MLNSKQIKKMLITYLSSLDQLHITIFASYINANYYDNQMVYEEKIASKTRVLLKHLSKLRTAISYAVSANSQMEVNVKVNDVAVYNKKSLNYDNLISCLEHLYEILFSLDLLKHRLLDHATFEICQAEFKTISLMISKVIAEKIFSIKYTVLPQNPATLIPCIEQLEVIFENTLQFVMADPMVFLFFLRDLKVFNTVMNDGLKNEILIKY